MEKWIDIKKQEPRVGQNIIACGTWLGDACGIGEDEYIGIGEWRDNSVIIDTDGGGDTRIVDVTDWMPLPTHPAR